MKKLDIHFRVRLPNGEIEIITTEALNDYARLYGLHRIAPDRYSSLFTLNMMMAERLQGIDPFLILEEIKFLEGRGSGIGTKPATKFNRPPLRGLWHKHFAVNLPGSFAHNILRNLGKHGLKNIVEKALDPNQSDVITLEMIDEIVENVVERQYVERADKNKLTGEWIVFAKHQHQNYYLSICSHAHGDHQIANNIRTTCVPEFPFLGAILDQADQPRK